MRLLGWPAAVLAMLIMLALVTAELTDARQRRWWAARPLTTDTVAGLLVLLVTVLVVNQLLNRQRGHAVAAQAAIMVTQAARSATRVPLSGLWRICCPPWPARRCSAAWRRPVR
jgi:hypothetical protein